MTTRRTRVISFLLLLLLLLIFAVTAEAETMTITQDTPSGTLKMRLRIHAHSFSYQLFDDGTTITALCDNSDDLCGLTNATATLTISAPESGGGVASLSGDLEALGVSSSNIMYAQKSGGTWGTASSNVPSGTGFFKASITLGGKTASVTYGVSAIKINSGITHGTITAP